VAKKATSKTGSKRATKSPSKSTALVERRGSDRRTGGERRSAESNMGDAFIKLLQSPLAAELVAIAATAALASLAEQGFNSSAGSRGKRAGKAVKEAGKAAAAAIGRRLGNEIDEIRKAAKASKAGAKA
jgi:hypothetical protein